MDNNTEDYLIDDVIELVLASGVSQTEDGFFQSDDIADGKKFVIQVKDVNKSRIEINYVPIKDEKNLMPKNEVARYVRNDAFAREQNDKFEKYQKSLGRKIVFRYEKHSIRKTDYYKADGEKWVPDNLNAKNRFSTFGCGSDDKFVFEAVQAILFSVGESDNLHTKVRDGLDNFLLGTDDDNISDELVDNLNKLIIVPKGKHISKEVWEAFFRSDNWGPTLRAIKKQKVIGKDSDFFKDSAKFQAFINEIDSGIDNKKYRGNTYYCVHPNLKFGQNASDDSIQNKIKELIGIDDNLTPADIYYVSSQFFKNGGYYDTKIKPVLNDVDALRNALNQAFLDMQAFGISLKQSSSGGELDLVNGKLLLLDVVNPTIAAEVLIEDKIKYISDTNIDDAMVYHPPFKDKENGEKSARSTLDIGINGGISSRPFMSELVFMKCNEGRGSDVTLSAKKAVARFGSAKGALSELFTKLMENSDGGDDDSSNNETIKIDISNDDDIKKVLNLLDKYYHDAKLLHPGEGIMELRKHEDYGAVIAAWQFFSALSNCNSILRKAMVAFFISYASKYELVLSENIRNLLAASNLNGENLDDSTVIDSSSKCMNILKDSEKKVVYFKYH